MAKRRHILISGGGTGVGAATALGFAKADYQVTICGRKEGPLAKIAARHKHIDWQICDVTDAANVADLVERARERHGGLEVVIANAGTALSKPFARLTGEDMRAMMDVNLMGVYHLFHAALPAIQKAKGGRLIAIASLAGLKGYRYVSAYVAAKHAVVGLVRSLALELASEDVTVNAICPGFLSTPLTERSIQNIVDKTGRSREEAEKSLYAGNPQQRFIDADEVASTALWLASDAARSVTGQAIAISGGEI